MRIAPFHPRSRSTWLLPVLPAAALAVSALHVIRMRGAGAWQTSTADATLYGIALVLCGLAPLARGLLARDDRAGWTVLGLGLTGFGIVSLAGAGHLHHGMTSFTADAAVPWATLYPFLIASAILLARTRADRFDTGLVLDGLMGGVTVAAVGAEVGLRPLLHHTHLRMGGLAVDGVLVASDLALLGVMLGCGALATSRGGRERALLAAGALVLAAADGLSLYHATAATAGLAGGWRALLVPPACALFACAAIVPPGRRHPTPARPVVGFTAVFALTAVTLQALDLVNATNSVAMVLSVMVLLAFAARISLSFRRLRESEQLRAALLEAEEQRRLVLDQMLRAEADERARIAEELHDDTVQVLTATLISLDRQRLSHTAGNADAAAEAAQQARDTLALALERTRRLMFELRPPLLEANGLTDAIRDLVEHANHELGLEVAVRVDVPRYSEAFETLVYRVVREGVANVRRHARARRLEVSLEHVNGELRGSVADDGRGFDVHRALDRHRTRLHLGLDATIERVRLAGGDIEIESKPGEGTRVSFVLPSAGSEAAVADVVSAVA